ncbi:hypothetical protein [Methylobacillus flagellatus]|nr:hypothetical protein [Methylobacillus flagellatus]
MRDEWGWQEMAQGLPKNPWIFNLKKTIKKPAAAGFDQFRAKD